MILTKYNLNKEQKELFRIYTRFLIQENSKYNLTTITEEEEIYIKHYYDSLELSEVIDFNKVKTFCDIGSGAGFPSIPLKIIYPHLEITIIEPTKKRCNFLEQLIELLGLDNIEVLNKRSEDIEISHRDKFDVASARAVANLPILLELTIPYVKVGGSFLAPKGSNYQTELSMAKNAIKVLNLKVSSIHLYELPKEMGSRSIINFSKLKKTNQNYPRRYSLIKKKHL